MSKVVDIGSRKWWAVGAISLGAIAFSLDLNVLSLALPTLSRALHASTNQLQWIVDAYSLALAVVLLPAGLLGDRYGRKKWMLIALAVFGLASLACAYSTSPGMLIAARVILGCAGAFILPLALSVIPVFFTDEERPKAIALLMGGVFVANPLGPILGGWLLSRYWWGSVFLINVPIVLLALIAIAIVLPENRSSVRTKIDYWGIILSGLGITGITYGAIQAESNGWGSSTVIATLIIGALLLVAFTLWERRLTRQGAHPLIDLSLFKSAGFTWGTILATGVTFVLFGLLFAIPQYFQSVEGRTALQSGVRLLSMVGGLVIGSVLASRVATKLGFKVVVAAGFIFMAAGLALGTTTNLQTHDSFTVMWIAILGFGLGLAMPIAVTAANGALSAERSGVGSALIQAMRQVGGTLGVAVLGTIIGSSYRGRLDLTGLPSSLATAARSSVTGGVVVAHQINSPVLLQSVRLAFVHALSTVLWVGVGIAIVSGILAVIFLPNRSAKAPEQPAGGGE